MTDGEGWFVVNARESRWRDEGILGSYCTFEGKRRFPHFGININVLGPGEAIGMYHRENAQEAFLVLAGECTLIVEGKVRSLATWDFFYCAPGTEHAIVATSEQHAIVLAVGARGRGVGGGVVYRVSKRAARHGAAQGRCSRTSRIGSARGACGRAVERRKRAGGDRLDRRRRGELVRRGLAPASRGRRDGDDPAARFRTTYLGGAGVVAALQRLAQRGFVELRRDYVPYLERSLEADPDFPDGQAERSLWMGETGIRLVLQRLAPSQANLVRLSELIAANERDERCELMWGSPGTILAGRELGLDVTASIEWLRRRREADGLWTQQLYGQSTRCLGPAHGLAGCVLALGDLPAVSETLERFAVEEDGLVNWPPLPGMHSTRTATVRSGRSGAMAPPQESSRPWRRASMRSLRLRAAS